MNVHAQELRPGAVIRLSPNGPKRRVVSNEVYPEDPRFRLVDTDRGAFFAPEHGRPIQLVEALP